MADPVTQTDLMDFERNVDTNFYNTRGDIKDSRFDIATRISESTAATANQLIALQRDTSDLRAQLVSTQQQMVAGFAGVAKDTEISTLKTQVEMAKQSTYLSDKIDGQAEKTRELINSLKEADLNRMLIERNAEIVEERGERRHWRYHADQGQWATLQSQIQNLNSQLGEAKSSMVNFGLMAGVGQSATSNNVR